MKTIKETIKEFDFWFAKNNIFLIPQAAAILKLMIITMFPAAAGILKKIENKNIADYKLKDELKIKTALKVICNSDGFIDFTRNIATEAAESNAPPCAPPSDLTEFARIKSILEAVLPAILDDMVSNDDTDNHLCFPLRYQDTQEYIIYKLSKKILDYPHLLNLDFKTATDFYEFEENAKGEIFRLLSIVRHAGNNAKQILKNANDAYYRKELSFDTKLKTTDTGKERSLYDIIPAGNKDPLSILIQSETEIEAQAIIDKLSEFEKQRLIAEFDKKQIESKGLLFDIDCEQENQNNGDNGEINIFKYRRKPKSSAPKQIDLFKGGDE